MAIYSMQRIDQRAANRPVARATVINQLHQDRLDPPQIREFPPHVFELLLGVHTRIIAVRTVIEP
ncbi:hypothetical protein, partial [Vibrio cholerae]|uniref:hypothetical protein n=1 Tax=Vibrio cholerae TaxID=666 RepID=UPI001C0F92E7|nr:hypothetical protein [Vibrio cholerae]